MKLKRIIGFILAVVMLLSVVSATVAMICMGF